MPAIKVIKGPLAGKVFPLNQCDVFIFGRSTKVHCSLPGDNTISRYHFLLEINGPDCIARDLGSLNGTWINGKKYGGRKPGEIQKHAAQNNEFIKMKTGDTIKAGDTELFFEQDLPVRQVDPPPEKTPINRDKEAKLASPGITANVPRTPSRPSSLLDQIVGAAEKAQLRMPEIPGVRIVGKIGQGGMGTVFRAKLIENNTDVAVKILMPPKDRIREMDVLLFQREMAITQGLMHPQIVTIYDQGFHEGMLYFIMELCDGGNTEQLTRQHKNRLPLELASNIFLEVLEGMSYAHKQGIVHRDLKPENILLKRMAGNLTAKIADFGLSKNYQQTGLSQMTMTGMGAGTLAFMPPEQLLDFKRVRPQGDIFCLGAMFYFWVCGEIIYDFESVEDPVMAILNGSIIPLSRRNVNVPRRLLDVIERSISIDPQERFEDAASLKRAFISACK